MQLTPRTETYGRDDQSWQGSAHGVAGAGRTITLDLSEFTAATHYPDGYLPSGLPLGLIDTVQPEGGEVGKYAPYDPSFDADSATAGTQSDGRDTLAGFLKSAVDAGDGTVDTPAALMWHGQIIVANLPIAFTVPADPGLFAFVE